MYHHVRRDQRIALAALIKVGMSKRAVARALGLSPATISRELHRNRRHGAYRGREADGMARFRRKQSKMRYRKIENNPRLLLRIERALHPLISPEVIAHQEHIAHETIYQWIYRSRKDLLPQLPQRGRRRRKYGSSREAYRGWTRLVHSIDERPLSKENWEGDTVKGSTRARLLTHVERTSLFTVADLLPRATADMIHVKVVKRGLRGTITYDRGTEFSLWSLIERDTNVRVFFAHPRHPWERGKNENTNGRLRRVFPKRFDFSTITQDDLDRVVHLMNHTPRKSLSWRTPYEVFKEMRCSSD